VILLFFVWIFSSVIWGFDVIEAFMLYVTPSEKKIFRCTLIFIYRQNSLFFFLYIFVIVILFSSLVAHSCCNPLILTVVSCCSHNYSYLWLFMILLLIIIALVVIKFKSHFISYGDDTYFVIIFIVLLYI